MAYQSINFQELFKNNSAYHSIPEKKNGSIADQIYYFISKTKSKGRFSFDEVGFDHLGVKGVLIYLFL